MANRIRVSDLDFVYISYMEPNKEENWADLKNKVPWAKRIDGVKGFDSAHKAAADTAEAISPPVSWQHGFIVGGRHGAQKRGCPMRVALIMFN